MDTADIWASMYVFPVITVIGVFILAGAVYFLSFRSKDDATDQSLKNYLDVLSGDDDKNRKAAKRLRKFGNSRVCFSKVFLAEDPFYQIGSLKGQGLALAATLTSVTT